MKSLTLKIAGLDLRLELSENKWHEYCQKKYANFVIDKLSASGLTIQVIFIKSTRAKDIKFRYLPINKVKIFFPNSLYHFDLFNYAVKNIFGGYLLNHQGCMFHGSAVEIGGRGVIFVGEPGAGKSTIAKKLKIKILADDRSLVRFIENKPRVFCSPFYDRVNFEKNQANLDLKAIFILKKKIKLDKIKIDRLNSSTEAVFRIIPHIVIREELPADQKHRQWQKVFLQAEKLVKYIPIYSLSWPLEETSSKELYKAIYDKLLKNQSGSES